MRLQFATCKFPKGLDTDELGKVRNLVRAVRMGLGLLLLPLKRNRSLRRARALVEKRSRSGVFEMAQNSE
jgi:hypothetical protein